MFLEVAGDAHDAVNDSTLSIRVISRTILYSEAPQSHSLLVGSNPSQAAVVDDDPKGTVRRSCVELQRFSPAILCRSPGGVTCSAWVKRQPRHMPGHAW